MFKQLLQNFIKANGRSPNAIEMLQLKFKAASQANRGQLLPFRYKRNFDEEVESIIKNTSPKNQIMGSKGIKGLELVEDRKARLLADRKKMMEKLGLKEFKAQEDIYEKASILKDKAKTGLPEFDEILEQEFAKSFKTKKTPVTEQELKIKMEQQNKEAAERIRKKQAEEDKLSIFTDERPPKDPEFASGGRAGFTYGGSFKQYINREDKYKDLNFEEWLREDKASGGLAHMLGEGGRIGFARGSIDPRGQQARARTEQTSEKIFKKLIEVAKTLESEEQKYMYQVVIPKTLIKLSADVGTKESQALRNFLAENPDLTKVDLSNIPLKFNDNTHLKTMLEIPLPFDIKTEITTDSSMTGSDVDKIELTSKNLDIEYDKKKNEIASDLNFDIGQGDINLSNVNYLNDDINTSKLDLKYPFNEGNLKATAFAQDGDVYRGELGYQGDGSGMKVYLDKDSEPSISAYKDFDNNIMLDADLSLDKEDLNQIGVTYRPSDNLNLFAKQDIADGGTTVGGDFTLFDTEDRIGNKSRFDISARGDSDGEKNAYIRYVKNWGSKDPGLKFQTSNPDEALDFLSSRRNLFQSGGRAGFYIGGITDVEPRLDDIGHGSDSLMARTRLMSPGSQATTSTGLNYLLAEDNDNIRVPFSGGGMSRRAFLKLMASLGGATAAAKSGILSVGGKQAAKETIKQTAGTPPPYFFKLVEKIKTMGDDVTPKYATKDREVVKKYKDFELTEDVATGEKTIQRIKTDTDAMYYDETLAEDVYMNYKPGKSQMDETTKGKTPPDEYIEDTGYLRTSGPNKGELYDSMNGLTDDTLQEIMEEVGEKVVKKADGGRIGKWMGGPLGWGKGQIRELLKFMARGGSHGKTPSEMLQMVNPKQFNKILNNPEYAGKFNPENPGGIPELIKNYTTKMKSDRPQMIGDLISTGKKIKKADDEILEYKNTIINNMINQGMDRKSAEQMADNLVEMVSGMAGHVKDAPKVTSQGLLEMENIQKNLLTKGRKLQANGGLTTMLGE